MSSTNHGVDQTMFVMQQEDFAITVESKVRGSAAAVTDGEWGRSARQNTDFRYSPLPYHPVPYIVDNFQTLVVPHYPGFAEQ